MFRTIKARIIATFAIALALVGTVSGIMGFQAIRAHEHTITDMLGQASAQSCAAVIELAANDKDCLIPGSEGYEDFRDLLRSVCRENRMTYFYACEYDIDAGTVRYLICVAADDDKDKYLESMRPYGTVVPAEIGEVELRALAGAQTGEAREFDNELGHMLDWFCRVDGWEGNVLAAASYSVDEQRLRVLRNWLFVVAPVAIALVVLLAVQLLILRRHVFRPLHAIASRMRAFTAEGAGAGEFEPLDISSRDEMGEIAEAFEGMAGDIAAYVGDIERLTTERVQAGVELDVARRIQSGMVPERLRVDGEGFEAFAYARPAREVGGDFHECLALPDGRCAVVVGDVSGKGMAAALFMAMSKTMIRDRLAAGADPADALNEVNEALCASNPEGMFVTVFAAVLDPATGTVRCVNAGHMPPLVVRMADGERDRGSQDAAGGQEAGGGCVRKVDVDPGIMLGLFEDAGLQDIEIHLAPGEALVLYTDGATEARGPEGEFLGDERFCDLVRGLLPSDGAECLVDAMAAGIGAFAAGNEQFDDLTLAVLARTAVAGEPWPSGLVGREVPVDIAAFARIRDAVLSTDRDDAFKRRVCLACEEAFVNVVSYSGATSIRFAVEDGPDRLRVMLEDDGVAFDPAAHVSGEKDFGDLDEGGMGISLVRDIASDMTYRRMDGRNILVLTFKEDNPGTTAV